MIINNNVVIDYKELSMNNKNNLYSRLPYGNYSNLSKEDEVCIMDEDNCVCFTSESIFFNRSGSLVVTCPR